LEDLPGGFLSKPTRLFKPDSGTSMSAPAIAGGLALLNELLDVLKTDLKQEIPPKDRKDWLREAILYSANRSFSVPYESIEEDFRSPSKPTEKPLAPTSDQMVQVVDPETTVIVIKNETHQTQAEKLVGQYPNSPHMLKPWILWKGEEESKIKKFTSADKKYLYCYHEDFKYKESLTDPEEFEQIPHQVQALHGTLHTFMPREIYGQGILDLRRAFLYLILLMEKEKIDWRQSKKWIEVLKTTWQGSLGFSILPPLKISVQEGASQKTSADRWNQKLKKDWVQSLSSDFLQEALKRPVNTAPERRLAFEWVMGQIENQAASKIQKAWQGKIKSKRLGKEK
jgi:hypothetical protein